MQYNSEANSYDIVSEVRTICGCTSSEYSDNDLARRFNQALDWYFDIAFDSDSEQTFDDSNHSDPPIDSVNIVSGTNRYKFSDFTDEIFSIVNVEILSSQAKGIYLIPETLENMGVGSLAPESGRVQAISNRTFQKTYIDAGSGTPTHYCKLGDYIYLRPNPDYNEANGLKLYINRPASYMTPSSTTTVPGVPRIHHWALCRKTALPWLIENEKPQAKSIAQLLVQDEADIRRYFAKRNKDIQNKMTPRVENNR